MCVHSEKSGDKEGKNFINCPDLAVSAEHTDAVRARHSDRASSVLSVFCLLSCICCVTAVCERHTPFIGVNKLI